LETEIGFNKKKNTLDVYYPKDIDTLKDVVVFVHGGSWNSGSKNSYSFLGRNFAKKNVVEVNINYRLSPEVKYEEMTRDVAKAVVWVYDHIKEYGGDPNRIFIAGHSAGGHLAALVSMDSDYFLYEGIENPIKGAFMIDAFCLDLVDYFKITAPVFSKTYYPIFSNNDLVWQRATPNNYVERTNIPFYTFVGSKTYPAIIIGTDRFNRTFEREGKSIITKTIQGKRHVGMILQMYFKKNQMYSDMLSFMKQNQNIKNTNIQKIDF
jgi:hypothetical protein